MDITRRSFIRWVISAGVLSACPKTFAAPAGQVKGKRAARQSLHSETNTVCHQVRDGVEMPKPAPSRVYDLVIVGGGASGLAAANHAHASDFLLLEKEDHVGGNAYMESWEGLDYCTGSAWTSFSGPAEEALFKSWGLPMRPIRGLDSAFFDGVWVPEFWNGDASHPSNDRLPYSAAVKNSVKDFCRRIAAMDPDKDKDRLDRIPFSDILRGYAPILKQFWDGFGMSNWGAPSELTSAALGIQAAKLWPRQTRYTFEGGLGVASRRLYERLDARAKKRVTLGAAVYEVSRERGRVVVRYMRSGEAAAVAARAVVMAVPKFITRHIVSDLPQKQAEAMAQVRFAPYLVYNLCFDRVVYNQAYDNWVVGARHFTDFIPADWVTHADGGDLGRKQVLTVYAPKLEESRAELLDDAKVLSMAQAAVAELVGLFPGWEEHLREVRIFRRGHPMFMPTPGVHTVVQPQAGRDLPPLFFAHSDNRGDVSDFMYASLNGIEAAKKALATIY